jgi:hypothetical protein
VVQLVLLERKVYKATGLSGATGSAGAQGIQGVAGTTGTTGATGLSGQLVHKLSVQLVLLVHKEYRCCWVKTASSAGHKGGHKVLLD